MGTCAAAGRCRRQVRAGDLQAGRDHPARPPRLRRRRDRQASRRAGGPRVVGAERPRPAARRGPRQGGLRRPGARHVRRRQEHRAPGGGRRLVERPGAEPAAHPRALPGRPRPAQEAPAGRRRQDRGDRLLLRRRGGAGRGRGGRRPARRGELPRRPAHRAGGGGHHGARQGPGPPRRGRPVRHLRAGRQVPGQPHQGRRRLADEHLQRRQARLHQSQCRPLRHRRPGLRRRRRPPLLGRHARLLPRDLRRKFRTRAPPRPRPRRGAGRRRRRVWPWRGRTRSRGSPAGRLP